MPSRHLYIFIGESFRVNPKLSAEVLGDSLVTSLVLAKLRSREGLYKVGIIACAQVIAIVWALDAYVMLFLAFGLTVKQLKTIRRLNVDLAAYMSYRHLAEERTFNYGREN